MRGRDKFLKYKKIITIFCKLYSIFSDKTKEKLLIKHRNTTGNLGFLIRYCLLYNLADYIGNNVSIHPGVYIFNPKKLKIGDNVSIHPMCYIEAYGGIVIGNDVSIAHSVTIMSVSHGFSDLKTNIKDQELIAQPITINNDIWIGAKATILGNVIVESGSIIGASALVNKNVEDNTIVAGVPAKVIKKRGN